MSQGAKGTRAELTSGSHHRAGRMQSLPHAHASDHDHTHDHAHDHAGLVHHARAVAHAVSINLAGSQAALGASSGDVGDAAVSDTASVPRLSPRLQGGGSPRLVHERHEQDRHRTQLQPTVYTSAASGTSLVPWQRLVPDLVVATGRLPALSLEGRSGLQPENARDGACGPRSPSAQISVSHTHHQRDSSTPRSMQGPRVASAQGPGEGPGLLLARVRSTGREEAGRSPGAEVPHPSHPHPHPHPHLHARSRSTSGTAFAMRESGAQQRRVSQAAPSATYTLADAAILSGMHTTPPAAASSALPDSPQPPQAAAPLLLLVPTSTGTSRTHASSDGGGGRLSHAQSASVEQLNMSEALFAPLCHIPSPATSPAAGPLACSRSPSGHIDPLSSPHGSSPHAQSVSASPMASAPSRSHQQHQQQQQQKQKQLEFVPASIGAVHSAVATARALPSFARHGLQGGDAQAASGGLSHEASGHPRRDHHQQQHRWDDDPMQIESKHGG